ncbi:MAG: phospholipid carrier-dependent glycosyltransferase, partial [Chloroflexota bacterium]
MDEFESRRALTAADGMVLAALTGLLFGVYLLTASLTFVSGDELFLFDATESFARHRSVLLSETSDLVWPGEASSEPGLPLLAAPIYWLANGFRGVGNVHATLLFNPLITALTAALVFLYARQLAFSRAMAVAVALAYGLTTIAWPYTKTFFREPLATLTLFASALCLLHWRDSLGQQQPPARTTAWLIGALAAGLASLFTKDSGIVGLPLLLLLLWPQLEKFGRGAQMPKQGWRTAALIALTLIVAVLGIWAFGQYFNGGRFDVIGRLSLMWRHRYSLSQGLAGFLFSPGKSLFVYSPVLVLALAGPVQAQAPAPA